MLKFSPFVYYQARGAKKEWKVAHVGWINGFTFVTINSRQPWRKRRRRKWRRRRRNKRRRRRK